MANRRVTYNSVGAQTAGQICYDTEYFGTEYFVSGAALLTAGLVYSVADAWLNWDNEYIDDTTWTPCCELICE